MNISIFTTVTNPMSRGDHFSASIDCYSELADEVIVVNGGEDLGVQAGFRQRNIKVINHEWPTEFDWPFIGQQFQRGYEACTGDWVIHADLDFIFHEDDFEKIREAFEKHPNSPALSFWKYQFILPDRYNIKYRLVAAVNKKVYGDRIHFDSGGDLCQPSLNGQQIKPEFVAEARVPFYNYEKITKRAEQVMADCGRMDRAYFKHFGKYQLSTDNTGSDESCFDGYILLMKARLKKPSEKIEFTKHPIFMHNTIRNLRPDQLGYGIFGLAEKADYYA